MTTLTVILSVLVMAFAPAGCLEERATEEGKPEKSKDLSVPSSSPSANTPEASSPDIGDPEPKRPMIRFDETDHDFGEVEAGDEVEHTFAFKNVGDDVLHVENVRTSCGCTGVLITSKDVGPGETGEIKATFLTKGFQGDVRKGLIVQSNDPENELVRLTIGGKVLSEVTVEPRYLNWNTIKREDPPGARKLTVRFIKERGLRLEKIYSESPSVVLTKESEQEDKVVYSVALAESLPTGRFTGRITVRTNSERMPEVHVPFYGSVQGSVSVTPYILSLGKIAPGEGSTRQLHLTKTGDRKFSVQKVKTTTPKIETEIIEKKKGSRYQVKVTYNPGSETKGRVSERITIFLDDGEQRFLEIPLYGTIDEGGKEDN